MATGGRTVTNDPTLIETKERRAYVLQLRKAGADYRAIAAAVIRKFGKENVPIGYDCRYAWKDVKRELDKLTSLMALDTEAIRALELQRLDDLLLSAWTLAVPPSEKQVDTDTRLKGISTVLKIMDRRARLVPNLAEPIPYDVTTGGAPIQVIGGLTLEDIA